MGLMWYSMANLRQMWVKGVWNMVNSGYMWIDVVEDGQLKVDRG